MGIQSLENPLVENKREGSQCLRQEDPPWEEIRMSPAQRELLDAARDMLDFHRRYPTGRWRSDQEDIMVCEHLLRAVAQVEIENAGRDLNSVTVEDIRATYQRLADRP